MKRLAGLAFVLLLAAPAWAQSPYVTGTIGAEVVRSTSTASSGSTFATGNGESWSGAIRLGTLVASRVGVELEWLRPAQIETDGNGPIYLANNVPRSVIDLIEAGVAPDNVIAPIIRQQTRMRTTTLSTLVFLRQPVAERVDLVYLGGIGFSRVVQEMEFGFARAVPPAGRLAAPADSTRTTQYGAGPVVGVEARIGMTEHVRLVAGMRLHALGQPVNGWLMRPNVGLSWTF
jgi:hypothetical protein